MSTSTPIPALNSRLPNLMQVRAAYMRVLNETKIGQLRLRRAENHPNASSNLKAWILRPRTKPRSPYPYYRILDEGIRRLIWDLQLLYRDMPEDLIQKLLAKLKQIEDRATQGLGWVTRRLAMQQQTTQGAQGNQISKENPEQPHVAGQEQSASGLQDKVLDKGGDTEMKDGGITEQAKSEHDGNVAEQPKSEQNIGYGFPTFQHTLVHRGKKDVCMANNKSG